MKSLSVHNISPSLSRKSKRSVNIISLASLKLHNIELLVEDVLRIFESTYQPVALEPGGF